MRDDTKSRRPLSTGYVLVHEDAKVVANVTVAVVIQFNIGPVSRFSRPATFAGGHADAAIVADTGAPFTWPLMMIVVPCESIWLMMYV